MACLEITSSCGRDQRQFFGLPSSSLGRSSRHCGGGYQRPHVEDGTRDVRPSAAFAPRAPLSGCKWPRGRASLSDTANPMLWPMLPSGATPIPRCRWGAGLAQPTGQRHKSDRPEHGLLSIACAPGIRGRSSSRLQKAWYRLRLIRQLNPGVQPRRRRWGPASNLPALTSTSAGLYSVMAFLHQIR